MILYETLRKMLHGKSEIDQVTVLIREQQKGAFVLCPLWDMEHSAFYYYTAHREDLQ